MGQRRLTCCVGEGGNSLPYEVEPGVLAEIERSMEDMPKGRPQDYNRYGDPKSGVKPSVKKGKSGKKK